MTPLLLAPALMAAQAAAPPVPAAPVVKTDRTPGDPFQKLNRRFFRGHQTFDRRFLRPAALGYARGVPKPVRHGIARFFSNLGEPLVFLSYLLELKPGKAVETAGRFVINSTLGLGGLVDVAAQPKVNLPHRPNSLADVLGYYGVGPGPYFFLPLVGPTTLRDVIAGQGEAAILPIVTEVPFRRPEYLVTRGVTNGLEVRAESDADLRALLDGAVDPYATFRSVWLQDRQGEIDALRGRPRTAPPAPELGEPLEDPAGTRTPPPSGNAPELSDPLADPAASPATPASASDAPELKDPLPDPAAHP